MINELLEHLQQKLGMTAKETPYDPNKEYTASDEVKKLMRKHGTDVLISDSGRPDIGYFMRGGQKIKVALPRRTE
jgi:hypothetical protein